MRTLLKFYAPLALLLFFSAETPAQGYQRDMEKEKPIWEELQAIAPKSVETFKTATTAMDKGDYEEAARLYEQVIRKAPVFDPALRRLGRLLTELGRPEEGIPLLESAVQVKRSPENLISLAQCLAYPGEGKEGQPNEKRRALPLAMEALDHRNEDTDPSYAFLVVQLSLELQQKQIFEQSVRLIEKEYPDLAATHYFSAVLAAMDEDWIKADAAIRKAEALGLSPEITEEFLASGVGSRATAWRYAYYILYLLAAWAVGLIVLFGLGKLLSNITLTTLENSDPNLPTASRELSLRKFYRNLINVAGLYYYLSIPAVIILVLALSGATVYAFLMLGRIPIKLMAILVIGSLVTIFMMVRSLFIRIKPEDPGRSLSESEAPALWAVVREVAGEVGTRPVDEIRVTPFTDLAVYEKGTFRERVQDQAKRILILGVGVLNDFKQDAFRAVLAHEYGHFSNRDTAGGDVALRVRANMFKFAHAIIAAEQAVWWNVAFHFVRVYDFIFRRISHGATRLQEALADRVAARVYGAAAFEEGLTHVVRRSIEFEDVAYWSITDALRANQPLQNLYEARPGDLERIEEKLNEEINRASSEDDTHPSPRDRFRLVSRIKSNVRPPSLGTVWELFANQQSLTDEMSKAIEQQAKAQPYNG